MKKCKKMLVTLLVMIMVINICACSRSSTQVSTSSDTVLKEPTKIVFFTVAETLDEDQMKAQFKEFEESNNCEIEIVFTSSSDFKQQYTTMVASGAQIDVMGINIQDIRYLYDTGAVLPLNDYIEIDKSKFVEGALDAAIWNDNVYAIPYGAFYTSMGLYYNERLFNELGFNVPATFEEFYDLADKAREAGYYASTFQAGNMYDLPVLYMLCLGQLVGGDGVGNIENICMGKAKYTDEVNVRAMQALADLAANGVWDDGFLGTTEGTAAMALFTSGQALTYITGSWNLTSMKSVMGDDLKVTYMPLIDKTATHFTTCAKNCPSICIYSGVEESKRQLLADFCEYISGASYQQEILNLRCNGDLSNSFDIPVYLSVDGNDNEILNYIKENFLPIGQDFLDWYWPPEVNAELASQIQAVLGRETTAEEAMAAVQSVQDKLFEEGYTFSPR